MLGEESGWREREEDYDDMMHDDLPWDSIVPARYFVGTYGWFLMRGT